MNGNDHLAAAKRCLARVEEITDEELVSAIVLEEMATSQALIAIAEELRAARERKAFVLPIKQEVVNLDAIEAAWWNEKGALSVIWRGYGTVDNSSSYIGTDARALGTALGIPWEWDEEAAGDANEG